MFMPASPDVSGLSPRSQWKNASRLSTGGLSAEEANHPQRTTSPVRIRESAGRLKIFTEGRRAREAMVPPPLK
ncbi:hypothetical protein D4764_21G0004210 [Takifugu flavidus]|uniref:Uncharacterized protein n=1 Tax=Takifugu flavidus TaxID=433684 RepID=A0A5C6NFY5_9TELE|nr:hypothetical protein D4764_21G0004210 [Takifugu flavidus]